MNDDIKISVIENKNDNTKTIKAKIWFESEITVHDEEYDNVSTRTWIEEDLKNHLMHYILDFATQRVRPFE